MDRKEDKIREDKGNIGGKRRNLQPPKAKVTIAQKGTEENSSDRSLDWLEGMVTERLKRGLDINP